MLEVGRRVRAARRRCRSCVSRCLGPHDERRAATSAAADAHADHFVPAVAGARLASVVARSGRSAPRCTVAARLRGCRDRRRVVVVGRWRGRRGGAGSIRRRWSAARPRLLGRRPWRRASAAMPNSGPMSASSFASGGLPAAIVVCAAFGRPALRDAAHGDLRARRRRGHGRRDHLVDAERREHLVLARRLGRVAADARRPHRSSVMSPASTLPSRFFASLKHLRVDARAASALGVAFGCAARGRVRGPALATVAHASSERRATSARFTSRAAPAGRGCSRRRRRVGASCRYRLYAARA